jgi:formylglycine-generating enzyme required for sulfatase activity
MTGNVWEWVSTPYAPSNKTPKTKTLRIVKGGGWASDKKAAQISFRNVVYPTMKNPAIGFRCAKSN